jgi:TRAP-type C4-dicarboxylate transport system permease small subunit
MAGTQSHAPDPSWFDRLIDALALVAGVLLVLVALLIVADVAGRSLRLYSIAWVLEATEYMLYGLTFLGAPWLLRDQGHIAIEILVERLPAPARRQLRRVTDAIGAAICGLLFVYACRVLWRSYESGIMIQKSFVFPEWVVYLIVPPVMLLLFGVYLRWLIRPPVLAPGAAAP